MIIVDNGMGDKPVAGYVSCINHGASWLVNGKTPEEFMEFMEEKYSRAA